MVSYTTCLETSTILHCKIKVFFFNSSEINSFVILLTVVILLCAVCVPLWRLLNSDLILIDALVIVAVVLAIVVLAVVVVIVVVIAMVVVGKSDVVMSAHST